MCIVNVFVRWEKNSEVWKVYRSQCLRKQELFKGCVPVKEPKVKGKIFASRVKSSLFQPTAINFPPPKVLKSRDRPIVPFNPNH